MKKRFNYDKLVVASSNVGKIKEIQELFLLYGIDVCSIKDFTDIKEPEETEKTFIGNAKIKARYYSKYTQYPVLADDSGLCVEALNNDPGVYSSRWAGDDQDYSRAISKIFKKLQDLNSNNYRAFYVCALVLFLPGGNIEFEEGKVYGTLNFSARGNNGFGYDPFFIPDNESRTFGEMPIEEKRKFSHRAIALNKMIDNHFV